VKGPREAGPASRNPAAAPARPDEAVEASIAAYLTAHPDFIARHPAVLQAMAPPSVDRGKVIVDFQRYMVARLQGDLEQATEERAALLNTARANAHNQSRIHAAALALIEARSLGQLIETLTGDLLDILDVDVIAMVVESNGIDVPHVAASGIRIVVPDAITNLMGKRNAILRGGIAGDPAIYGPGAGLIASEALLRLDVSRRTPVGLVAFGSRNPEAFEEGQGTEHIAFLGGVLERLLRAWLDLPA
jgi:uncharacterized protein YigA (DUF484 family)